MSKKEASHPTGHNCPDRQKFDVHAGKCVDEESVNDDSSRRNKSASNLVFPKVTKISGTAETSNLQNDNDVHTSPMQDKADKLMSKSRIQSQRAPQSVQDRKVPGMERHEFRPFKAKHGGSN